VLLVEVDPIHAEPAGAAPRSPGDHEGQADRKDLGGEEDSLTLPADRLTYDALGTPDSIDLGRVDQVHAQLQRSAHDFAGHLARVHRPVAPLPRAELPRAQPDRGNAHATDLNEFHSASRS
jgi:hypothetical protein